MTSEWTAIAVVRQSPQAVRALAALYVLQPLAAALPLVAVWLLKTLIDHVSAGRFDAVPVELLLLLLSSLASVGAEFGARVLSTFVATELSTLLQARMFDRFSDMPLGFFTTTKSGALVSRLTNDASATQDIFVSVLPTVISTAVTIAGTVLILSTINPWLIALGLVLPICLALVRTAEARINALAEESFSALKDLSSDIDSFLSYDGIVLARLNDEVPAERIRFISGSRRVAKATRSLNIWAASTNAFYGAGFALMTIGAIAVCAVFNVGGSDQVGTLLLVVLYVQQLQRPVQALLGTRYPRYRAGTALDRCLTVLLSGIRRNRTAEAATSARTPNDAVIAFDHVEYVYPSPRTVSIPGLSHAGSPLSVPGLPLVLLSEHDKEDEVDETPRGPVISNVSFEVRRGEFVGLVGTSGAGKSTIAQLAVGLETPTSGTVRLLGRATSDTGDRDLGRDVALISQSAHILHESIRANLLYAAPEASTNELLEALEKAGLSDFLSRLPEGMETVVGEQGHRISGGEAQRLSIARVFLKQPALVVLDEPTAHLDGITEEMIRTVLRDQFRGAAMITIAHRLSTVRDADRILVLDRGQIAESGTHDELLSMRGVYTALAKSQNISPEV